MSSKASRQRLAIFVSAIPLLVAQRKRYTAISITKESS